MARGGRLLLLLLLARWTCLFLLWPMRQDVIGSSFLHVISIPFHEAGHILFSPFGDLLMSLGGSLMQVIVPVICWITFATTSPNPFGRAVMCWWTGANLLDVAIYIINDARSLSLVLLGGQTGAEVEGHDWERILGLTDLTVYDHRLVWTVAIGALMMLAGLVWGATLAAAARIHENTRAG